MVTIYHTLTIAANAAKVFDAISFPKELNNWWTLECSGERCLGGEYNLFFSEEYNWIAKVSKYAHNALFEMHMQRADTDWEDTQFGFELKHLRGGTELNFYHSGWKEANQHYKQSSFCWAMLLMGLKNYVEHGSVVPFQERA